MERIERKNHDIEREKLEAAKTQRKEEREAEDGQCKEDREAPERHDQ